MDFEADEEAYELLSDNAIDAKVHATINSELVYVSPGIDLR